MKFTYSILFLLLVMACSEKVEQTPVVTETFLEDRLTELSKQALSDLEQLKVDSTLIPRSLNADGTFHGTVSRQWTSGFYPGMLWQLYHYSQNEQLKEAAIQWQSFVEKEKNDASTHDLGFKVYCPFGNAYQITEEEAYKNVFVTAAQTLVTRYNPKVGAIRSWDHHEHLWKYPVIIDNMMNLEMLFETTKVTGDSMYYNIALAHAETTLENHFREDYSSYHVIDYDVETGEVVKKNTHQGHNHESAWSRGQAWGLYGFAVVYRYTGDQRFLDQSKAIANFFFEHPRLPEDYIPYWDFDAPSIPDEPRDVSAATIAASGLLELCQHDPVNRAKYLEWTDQILLSLNKEPYQTDTAPFLLDHSVGSIPGEFEVDVPIVYADYFYVEALLRRMKVEQALALSSK